MRDIKFRAWDYEKEKMLDWKWLVGYCDLSFLFESNSPEDVFYIKPMQFTGLQDKFGRDIYEGDIVQEIIGGDGRHEPFEFKEMDKEDSVVTFFDGAFTAYCACVGEINHRLDVIGNIHQNPELLEVGNND